METQNNVTMCCLATNTTTPHTASSPCDHRLFAIIINLVVTGVICLLGLAGNIISIIILQQERAGRAATLLLQCLAVSDNAFLLLALVICSLFMGFIPNFTSIDLTSTDQYIKKYVNPVAYMVQSVIVWHTVLLAVNRYVAVVWPLHASSWLTPRRTQLQLLAASAFSLLYNLPRFFQVHIVYNAHGAAFAVSESSIGSSSVFGKAYDVLYTLLVVVIPFILILVLNVRLIRTVHEARRGSVRRQSSSSGDDNITLVMVIIVIMFVVCHTPDRVLQIVEVYAVPLAGVELGCARYPLHSVCNLLIVVNSSANFLVYYLLRPRFRRLLGNALCARCHRDTDDDTEKIRLTPLTPKYTGPEPPGRRDTYTQRGTRDQWTTPH